MLLHPNDLLGIDKQRRMDLGNEWRAQHVRKSVTPDNGGTFATSVSRWLFHASKLFPLLRRLGAILAVGVLSAVVLIAASDAARASTVPKAQTRSSGTASTATTTISSSIKPFTPTTATRSTTTQPQSCLGDAAAVQFYGQRYCPGYVVGVKQTAYGVGARIVLSGVVVQVAGTAVTMEGGPSCLPQPGVYCGAIIPSVTTRFDNVPTVPRYGDVLNLYGITASSTITATGYTVAGQYDPEFG